MSSRVYALANQKGGVGKTTTAINMAACVAEAGTPVLLIDLDPQANATTGLGFRPDQLEASTYDLLHGRPLDSVIIETGVPNLFLAPSHPDLAAAQVEIPGGADHGTLLRDLLAGTESRFPYVFVDCPPSLGLLTVNALAAANRLIVPVQCEYYALEGLAQLLQSVELVRTRINPRLGVTGVLLTMFDGRTRLAADVASEVRSYFGPLVFDTVVPRSVRLAEAPEPRASDLPLRLGLARCRRLLPRGDGGRRAWLTRPRHAVSAAGSPRSWPSSRAAAARRRSRSSSIGSGPTRASRAASFDDGALDGLVESIRAAGLVQPIVVRDTGDGFEIIAGERRWRAARQAGLGTIPAIVRHADEREALILALAENVAREDLNAVELARAYAVLADELDLSQTEIARRVGRSRPAIANTIRLLELPDDVLGLIAGGELSEGHGRALLLANGQDERLALARRRDPARVVGARHRGRGARHGAQDAQAGTPRGRDGRGARPPCRRRRLAVAQPAGRRSPGAARGPGRDPLLELRRARQNRRPASRRTRVLGGLSVLTVVEMEQFRGQDESCPPVVSCRLSRAISSVG